MSKDSFGVDNFRIVADCSRRRLKKDVATEEKEGYYCSSMDFPCSGGTDMVSVCHYSTRKGYETFCIPEADSEILRFYPHDYCGPCVGGFGGDHVDQN